MESVEAVRSKNATRNQPWIAMFCGEGGARVREYFIICEEKVLCKVNSLENALFVTFSAYFCFNLEYPVNYRVYFIQDYVLNHPDSVKKSALYISSCSIRHQT